MTRAAIGVLALVVVGLAIYSIVTITGLQGDVSRLQTRANALQHENRTLAGRLTTIERPIGEWAKASDLTALTTRVDDVARRLKTTSSATTQLKNCLPEVQAELDSLDVEDGWPVFQRQVSHTCTPVVYGARPGGE